jgi:tRNA(fMet)-specific endonuclease VapC
MFLLDTNICIYIIKKNPARVLERLTALDPTETAISSITLAELEFGVEKSQQVERNRRALGLFVAPLEILPFDEAAARVYGAVRSELERRGRPIGALDLLIAAQALALGATLVTNNQREFGHIAGLSLENWARA